MRWENLWSDLEAQSEALERDDLEAEVADRAMIEQSSVLLMDRCRASVGRRLRCTVAGGDQWRGTLLGCGVDWLSLGDSETDGRTSALVPAGAITGLEGLASQALPVEALGMVARRLTLALALRRLVVAREHVRVHRAHSVPTSGHIVLVGGDYLDILDDDSATVSVPMGAVVAVALS